MNISKKIFYVFFTLITLLGGLRPNALGAIPTDVYESCFEGNYKPKFKSVKTTTHAEAISDGTVDYVMNGVDYYKVPNQFRSEIIQAEGQSQHGITIVSDGKYQWVYYEISKSAEREDIRYKKNELKKIFGYLPGEITKENCVYTGEEDFKGEKVGRHVVPFNEDTKANYPYLGERTEYLFDKEFGIIRASYYFDADNKLKFSVEYTVVEIDKDYPDDLFKFEPPPGTRIQFIPESSEHVNLKIISIICAGLLGIGIFVFYRIKKGRNSLRPK